MWWKAQHGRILGTPGGWNSENKEQRGQRPPHCVAHGSQGVTLWRRGACGEQKRLYPCWKKREPLGFHWLVFRCEDRSGIVRASGLLKEARNLDFHGKFTLVLREFMQALQKRYMDLIVHACELDSAHGHSTDNLWSKMMRERAAGSPWSMQSQRVLSG